MLVASALVAVQLPQENRGPNPEEFRNPRKQYRPWTVWWWFGNASDEEDLAYELAEMDRAGIGGAEINPVYPLSEDDPEKGIRNVPLFSEEWKKRFAAALREAERRGMKLVLRAGSGWPLGGPWIPRQGSSKAVARGFLDLRGPGRFARDLPSPIASENWTIDALERVVAVEKQTYRRLVIPTPVGQKLKWGIPPGEWRLYAIYRMFTNQEVKRATPGGEGLVLDHFNATSLALQLRQLDGLLPTIRRFGPNTFFGIAADSLELDDSNWTDDFLAEFQRLQGYDLTPYLPDLWDRLGPETRAVRQDFLEVLSRRHLECHFRLLTDWAHRRNLRSNAQAHGTIADILAAYDAVDQPEGETIWPGTERHEVNLRNRRLAVSAAHIYGPPGRVVSGESYTWLRMPRFLVPLSLMKAASDAIYLDGINQIKNHGYASSPRRLGKPGWVFYASTLINHNQTWWPHYPALAAYVTRMNYLMQSGRYVADIALYHNLPDARAYYDVPPPEWFEREDDAWHHHDRDPGLDSSAAIAMRLQECADLLQRAGYGFDVINDDALLNHTRISGGNLRGRETSYRALVFYYTESVPVPTLRRARDFLRAGGHVIAVGGLPTSGVGLMKMAEQRREISALVEEIWRRGSGVFVKSLSELQAWLDRNVMPDFRMKSCSKEVGFIHRRAGNHDVYFVANGAKYEVSTELAFRASGRIPEWWNPMDGTVSSVQGFRTEGLFTVIPVKLGPWESTAFLFRPAGLKRNNIPQKRTESVQTQLTTHPVEGIWEVSFGDPLNRSFHWESLRDWLTQTEAKDFSGLATYRLNVTLPADFDISRPTCIELGEVRESAEVLVNGKSAGIAFMAPYTVAVTGLLKPGLNQLEVRVANLWNNYILSLPKTPSKIPAPGYGLTDVLYGPSERKPLPSGLLGPVRVVQEGGL